MSMSWRPFETFWGKKDIWSERGRRVQRLNVQAGKPEEAEAQVTAEVQLTACTYGDWARYTLRLDASIPPEPVSVAGPDGGPAVTGRRHRLEVSTMRGGTHVWL